MLASRKLLSTILPIFANEKNTAASYPIRESRFTYRSDENVEVAAELVTLAAEPHELDQVIAALVKLRGVSHATWNVSAME